ncbi:AAA family ATPase [Pseudomonas fluorescens]|nr:AAA family ATPase [Pseudomonas fluorescens]
MIITSVTFDDKTIPLCGANYNATKNIFTILVGRNGSGKSALLNRICLITLSSLLSENGEAASPQDYLERAEANSNKNNNTGLLSYILKNEQYAINIDTPKTPQFETVDGLELSPEAIKTILTSIQHYFRGRVAFFSDAQWSLHPTPNLNIIAVSSSPFDKFPIIDSHTSLRYKNVSIAAHYTYRGAKTNTIGSKSYLESKFDQLGQSFINFFLNYNSSKDKILPLFNFLGINSKLKLTLRGSLLAHSPEYTEDGLGELNTTVNSARFFKNKNYHDFEELNELTKTKITTSAYEVIKANQNSTRSSRDQSQNTFILDLDINSNQKPLLLDELSTLIEYDLLDLENIEFIKSKDNKPFRLTEASSGELCILFNVLAIAGAITDNSVILIDEPELSLHPEWQTNFLPLLESIFSKYNGCHFIIATHSPQIISSMEIENSFVVNLENTPPLIIEGNRVHSHSADFQLANVFRAPGPRNEYLISQIINTLTQIRDGKQLDDTFLAEIDFLIQFNDLIPPEDPVKKLLSTLIKAMKVIRHD